MYRLLALLFLLALPLAAPAAAQQLRTRPMIAAGANYRTFAPEGSVTIQVNYIGPTGSALFEIVPDMPLDQFLVVSGVTLPTDDDRTIQTATVRVYREQGGVRTLVLEENLETTFQDSTPLVLQQGDWVLVETETETRFHWRDVTQVISAGASMVLLALRLAQYF